MNLVVKDAKQRDQNGDLAAKDVIRYHIEAYRELGISEYAWSGLFIAKVGGDEVWDSALSDNEVFSKTVKNSFSLVKNISQDQIDSYSVARMAGSFLDAVKCTHTDLEAVCPTKLEFNEISLSSKEAVATKFGVSPSRVVKTDPAANMLKYMNEDMYFIKSNEYTILGKEEAAKVKERQKQESQKEDTEKDAQKQEAKQKAEQEAQQAKTNEEAKKATEKAESDKKAVEEAEKLKQEQKATAKAQEEAAAKQAEEKQKVEADKKAAEDTAKQQQEQAAEAQKQQADEEAKKAAGEAKKVKQEQEAKAQQEAQVEQQQKAEVNKKASEDAAAKQEQEANNLQQEQEAKAQEETAAKQAEETQKVEADKKAAEDTAKQQQEQNKQDSEPQILLTQEALDRITPEEQEAVDKEFAEVTARYEKAEADKKAQEEQAAEEAQKLKVSLAEIGNNQIQEMQNDIKRDRLSSKGVEVNSTMDNDQLDRAEESFNSSQALEENQKRLQHTDDFIHEHANVLGSTSANTNTTSVLDLGHHAIGTGSRPNTNNQGTIKFLPCDSNPDAYVDEPNSGVNLIGTDQNHTD